MPRFKKNLIIKCPSCNENSSSNYSICPNCGYYYGKKERENNALGDENIIIKLPFPKKQLNYEI